MREDELLAILDAGPVTLDDLAALSRRQQRQAAASINALIELLDALDGDEDFEPDADMEDGADDEHSLGSPEVGFATDWRGSPVFRDGTLNQERWGMGSRCPFTSEAEAVDEDGGDILEQPHDGDGEDLEPDVDKEPELGWSEGETLDQRWAWGFDHTCEQGETPPPKRRMRHTEPPGSMARRVERQIAAMRGQPPAEIGTIRVVGFAGT